MNRSAYLTTGLAIKVMSRLSKADIVVHDKSNLPKGPIIFVMNHFTRVETLLLPYYIYNLTQKPVWSLASATLFKGGLEKFFDLVGVVSTADPQRDKLIVRSLLTGEADWIIFPEGSMVKTKKIVAGGKYMIANPTGMHEPHTGAAALALRAELFRQYLASTAEHRPGKLPELLAALEIDSYERIQPLPISILPVNLTYYPIRAAENLASTIASKLVKDMSERMVEEIMTEGTMLFTGVDLDIRIGKPISMADHLQDQWLKEDMERDSIRSFSVSEELKERMRETAYAVMQKYMHEIYAMVTVNHEHLFASFLRLYPFRRIREDDFITRVFYAATIISRGRKWENLFNLHKSLKKNQAHLLTDDRFHKYENFFKLAVEKGVVEKYGDYLLRDPLKLSAPISFHRGRIDNPVEVMANEAEPLQKLLSMLRWLAWQPPLLMRLRLVLFLLKMEKIQYREDCEGSQAQGDWKARCGGAPFLLPAFRRKMGVVLVHSYLSVPEEVRELARYLRRRGYWVYAPRLPGHGTTAEDLATRNYKEWFEAVENGYVLMSKICDRVVLGGISVGGNIALDLASRIPDVAGIFAVSPPFALRDYSSNFMPVQDVWNRILSRMKRDEQENEFLDFFHGNLHVNYPRNPVSGVNEVGEYLATLEENYAKVTQPALVIQADRNPIVDPKGSQQLYEAVGSADKEFCLLNYDRHVLVNGEGALRVHRKIGDFMESL